MKPLAIESSTPRLAVIVPIFRHPSLVIEAIESVLAQSFAGGIRLILVNDGCPLPETDLVCREYRDAYPNIVTYLPKPNGGLSDARNCGVRYVLEHLPSVEAVYLLDADNRIRHRAMEKAMAVLDAHPDKDWVYPNIDMFGLEWRSDYGGPYSLLIHTSMNICEAGSLIRRRVFEAGILFDTDFKMGWEDWDFFLSAASKGFRGENLEDFGFQYRKRPESMLADSNRDSGAIDGAMKQKHKKLFSPASLVALEQAEAPRYAIHLTDRGEVLCCVDPSASNARRLSVEQFDIQYWQSILDSGRQRTPPINVFMTSGEYDGLRKAGLLHWSLWKLESICDRNEIGALVVEPGADNRLAITKIENAAAMSLQGRANVLAIPVGLFDAVLRDSGSDWIDSLPLKTTSVKVTAFVVQMPRLNHQLSSRPNRSGTVYDLLSAVHRLRASPWREAALQDWGFRAKGIPVRCEEHRIVRRAFEHAPAFPRVRDGRRHIGFLLPIVEFGGVEKVAQQMAMGLRAHGWIPHAIVLEASEIAYTQAWQDAFESTSLFAESSFECWGQGLQDYLGTNVPAWAQSGTQGPIIGMLHWLDAVVNCHGGSVAGVMGQLRRLGIKTVNSLHLNDLTPLGRSSGNTYLGLAFEHAFDLFAPCSNQLGTWLHGMGVPANKIVPVPNAPGFDVEAASNEAYVSQRRARNPSEPLRLLYIGRLDRQKGMDRLAEVMRRCSAEGLNVTWRIIGKALMSAESQTIPPEITSAIEPPISDPSGLAAAYGWADAVVLLSRYEGLPLTTLEAMRSGAVMIATDVGATGEVVIDGHTGFLLSGEKPVESCMRAIRLLTSDRSLLARLSNTAYAISRGRTWQSATLPLHEALSRLIEPAR